MTEIKNCPFCGGEAHWSPTYIDADEPGTVVCGNCGGTVICSGSKDVRIAAWNTRHREQAEAGEAVPVGRLQPSGDGEPVAFLKFWWNEGKPCTRVDLTDICEPWLDALKPTITPLYTSPPPAKAEPSYAKAIEDALDEMLAAQMVQPYRGGVYIPCKRGGH